jgi:hypothetical protein
MRVCAICGAPSYARRSAFCTRCGSSDFTRRSYGAPSRERSSWKSLPLMVRFAIYVTCIPILIGAAVWALFILHVLIH